MKQDIYISRKVLNQTDIEDWARNAGFTSMMPLESLHVTVVYCKLKVDWDLVSRDEPEMIEVPECDPHQDCEEDRAVHQFDGGATVLEIFSDDLLMRNEELRSLGIHSKFPDYRSHITITYEKPDDLDVESIEPYRGPIFLGPEIIVTATSASGWEDSYEEHKLSIQHEPITEKLSKNDWLKGSDVQNVVYHGSANEFDSFDLNKVGSNTKAKTAYLGIFATDNIYVAERFGKVIPLHMRLVNPLVLGATDVEHRNRMAKDPFFAMHDAIVKFNKLASWDDVQREHVLIWKKRLQSSGWDGIIIQHTVMDGAGTARSLKDPYHHFYIAFSSNQVKLATTDEVDPDSDILHEERLWDFDQDRLYDVFRSSYEETTGQAWSKEKFLDRARDWTFYGDQDGYVAFRVQNSGMVKLVGVAGSRKSILLGIKRLLGEDRPVWGAVSLELAQMAKKLGMIVPHQMVGGPTVMKVLMKAIPASVFGGVEVKVNSDGGVTIGYKDIGDTKKYLIANRQYFKALLTNPIMQPYLKNRIVGKFVDMVAK